MQINNAIISNAEKYGFRKNIVPTYDHEKIIPMYKENHHFFIHLLNEVNALDLQMSITLEERVVRMLMFPSPRVVQGGNIDEIIGLANTANQYLVRGLALGRFWVDTDSLDLAYEVLLPYEILDGDGKGKLIEEQLFENPINHYRDLLNPLIMLRDNQWDEQIATTYLIELREKGYISNEDYGI